MARAGARKEECGALVLRSGPIRAPCQGHLQGLGASRSEGGDRERGGFRFHPVPMPCGPGLRVSREDNLSCGPEPNGFLIRFPSVPSPIELGTDEASGTLQYPS